MRLNEILIERGDTYFDNAGRVHFKTHDAYLKAKNSDWDKMRLAAKDWSDRNPPVGEFWPKDWNAPPQQDQYGSQMTATKPPPENPEYTVRRDANKVSTADLGRPDDGISAIAGGGADVPTPKPKLPMGGRIGVINRKKQK
tara:strand:- start:1039 stop:1461 length:423 start_codon:yes stop_codon:yes gene_type:complete